MDTLSTHITNAIESESEFLIADINLSEPGIHPIKIAGGAICICRRGKALLNIDTATHPVEQGTEIILFPDMTFLFEECNNDFTLSMFIFSRQIFSQALIKFNSTFFQRIYTQPTYLHQAGGEEIALCYFRILGNIKSDSRNTFRTIIAINLLRSMMLNIYDKHIRFSSQQEKFIETRKEELYNRFMTLISEYGKERRDVAFYAERLCITPRYLEEITGSIAGETPKETIDFMIIQEIKLILTFSQMTLQQVADHLNFPDQSYLGRYFKRHTGISPAAYRKKALAM